MKLIQIKSCESETRFILSVVLWSVRNTHSAGKIKIEIKTHLPLKYRLLVTVGRNKSPVNLHQKSLVLLSS